MCANATRRSIACVAASRRGGVMGTSTGSSGFLPAVPLQSGFWPFMHEGGDALSSFAARRAAMYLAAAGEYPVGAPKDSERVNAALQIHSGHPRFTAPSVALQDRCRWWPQSSWTRGSTAGLRVIRQKAQSWIGRDAAPSVDDPQPIAVRFEKLQTVRRRNWGVNAPTKW